MKTVISNIVEHALEYLGCIYKEQKDKRRKEGRKGRREEERKETKESCHRKKRKKVNIFPAFTTLESQPNINSSQFVEIAWFHPPGRNLKSSLCLTFKQ